MSKKDDQLPDGNPTVPSLKRSHHQPKMPPKLLGSPKSWKTFVVALLPHNGCYERHTDDHIKAILSDVLNHSDSTATATPRNKSIFQRLNTTDVKSIQAKLKEDEKNGLARKKQQVADALAAKAARIKLANEKIVAEKKRAEALAKKSKHMSRAAREKQAADSLARQQQLEASIHLDEIPSVESDPTGITGALANIRAPPSPIKSDATKGGGGGGASIKLSRLIAVPPSRENLDDLRDSRVND